jgi:NAD-dependent DNA ligase
VLEFGESSNTKREATPMDTPAVASSKRSVDTVVGKVLVAKRTFSSFGTRLGTATWDVPAGTTVIALMEGSGAGYGNRVIKCLYNGMRGEIPLDYDFDANWGIISPDDRLGGKTFVFTGALTNTRDYYKTLVECFGGSFGTAVSGKTSYLVMGDATFQGDPNHQSTKAKKAKSFGVKIVGEAGFFRLING